MKLGLAWLACSVGCGFQSPAIVSDASPPVDAPREPGLDASSDAPGDAPAGPRRTRAGLIGLWEFDETSGTTINDTSDDVPRIALAVTQGAVSFSSSEMTPDTSSVIESAAKPHLDADVDLSKAVTLEAWVIPSSADQGSLTAPAMVAGLSPSPIRRNISLLQAGKRWLARVRTTSDENGGPDLVSSVDITAGVMTHLVVVSDATQRILYVNGKPDAVDPAPTPPAFWDTAYRMELSNERTMNRPWSGSFALVAMYKQALSDALVAGNYLAGP
jgi:hypothetical protein